MGSIPTDHPTFPDTKELTLRVFVGIEVAGLAGLEPATNGLGNHCSIHLSYSPAWGDDAKPGGVVCQSGKVAGGSSKVGFFRENVM